MKIKGLPILVFILACFILFQPLLADAVVNWTKHGDNPVLEGGGSGAWDEFNAEGPAVIKDNGIFKIWYTAGNGSLQIGYASSPDGINWSKEDTNPVLLPSGSGWDSMNVHNATVIKDGSTYKMWYTGNNHINDELNNQIGYATSNDGINWTKDTVNNPVLRMGGANEWDATGVLEPTVIKDGSTYKMWYVGFAAVNTYTIGHATSPDGISWDKWDNPFTTESPYANSDPVLFLGPLGSWEDWGNFSPSVIKEGSIYRMWFDGEGSTGPARIGYAYSHGGMNWRKYEGNPIVMEGPTGAFDENSALEPMVLKDGNVYKMWYSGDKAGCNPQCVTEIGYATSPAYQGTWHNRSL